MTTAHEDILKSFRVTSSFRDFNPNGDKRINAMTISTKGNLLVASGNNNALQIYDCNRGKQIDTIYSHKYGCGMIDFTDSEDVIVIGSMLRDHIIRTLNIEKKSYVQYFIGHTGYVIGLSMNRRDNLLLSYSLDRSVRLWDARTPCCVDIANFKGEILAAWNSNGCLIAVGLESESIEMYDVRKMRCGFIKQLKFNQEYNARWIDMKFSKTTDDILISTSGSPVFLYNSYNGRKEREFRTRKNAIGIPIEATFSTDSEHVLSGSSDGRLHIWSTNNGEKVAEIESQSSEAITNVICHPHYSMLATASSYTAFWTPVSGF